MLFIAQSTLKVEADQIQSKSMKAFIMFSDSFFSFLQHQTRILMMDTLEFTVSWIKEHSQSQFKYASFDPCDKEVL